VRSPSSEPYCSPPAPRLGARQLAARRETRSTHSRSPSRASRARALCGVVLLRRRRRIDRLLLVYTAASISRAPVCCRRRAPACLGGHPSNGPISCGPSPAVRWVYSSGGRCPPSVRPRSVGLSIVRRPKGIYRISKYELRFEVQVLAKRMERDERRGSNVSTTRNTPQP
jgi:hypothetical protein